MFNVAGLGYNIPLIFFYIDQTTNIANEFHILNIFEIWGQILEIYLNIN